MAISGLETPKDFVDLGPDTQRTIVSRVFKDLAAAGDIRTGVDLSRTCKSMRDAYQSMNPSALEVLSNLIIEESISAERHPQFGNLIQKIYQLRPVGRMNLADICNDSSHAYHAVAVQRLFENLRLNRPDQLQNNLLDALALKPTSEPPTGEPLKKSLVRLAEKFIAQHIKAAAGETLYCAIRPLMINTHPTLCLNYETVEAELTQRLNEDRFAVNEPYNAIACAAYFTHLDGKPLIQEAALAYAERYKDQASDETLCSIIFNKAQACFSWAIPLLSDRFNQGLFSVSENDAVHNLRIAIRLTTLEDPDLKQAQDAATAFSTQRTQLISQFDDVEILGFLNYTDCALYQEMAEHIIQKLNNNDFPRGFKHLIEPMLEKLLTSLGKLSEKTELQTRLTHSIVQFRDSATA